MRVVKHEVVDCKHKLLVPNNTCWFQIKNTAGGGRRSAVGHVGSLNCIMFSGSCLASRNDAGGSPGGSWEGVNPHPIIIILKH